MNIAPDQMAVYHGFGFSERFSHLLFARNIISENQIKEFFDFSPSRLQDPFKLSGMREATDRINTAILKKEQILIIGDYDCDGICATAILYKYFLTRHARVKYFLPNRDADGYGLTVELIEKLHERFSPNLIITVDCGISCPKEVERAKELGVDVIVTDHHSVPAVLPDCICVNPKIPNQDYTFNGLCGAGVALKVVQALGGLETAKKYIDICSVATVADIVPLQDENRVIVGIGLKMLNEGSNPAITALAKSCNVYGQLRSSDISYKLGPKINASGRMGNAKRGIDLLLEKDEKKVNEIIRSLDELNAERRKLCQDIAEAAERMVAERELYKNNIIIVFAEEWEGGVLGIVSARLVDKYNKPTIVFSKSENVWKGSGRSVGDFNMVGTLEQFSPMIANYGGHFMAAGLSVSVDCFDKFCSNLTEYTNSLTLKCDSAGAYEFELPLDKITHELVRELELLEPFGCENPSPIFVTTLATTKTQALTKFPNHLRFNALGSCVSFMYFDGAINTELLQSDTEKKIIFEFQKLDENSNQIRAIVKGLEVVLDNSPKTMALALWASLVGGVNVCDGRLDEIITKLQVDRNIFVEYYMLIRGAKGKKVIGVYDLYEKLKKSSIAVELEQLVLCCAVFVELGILRFEGGLVRVNEGVKTELEKSSVYNKIKKGE